MSGARVAKTSNGALLSARSRRRLSCAALALSALLLPAVGRDGAARDLQHNTATPHAHVYLMRGLMNIFSLGMDELAAKIARHGIEASVHNHAEADEIVAGIAARYADGDRGPIILIGHSLGADAVMRMAQSLNDKGVPVALVVPFDGTGSYAAPKNVACVLNLTQRDYARMRAGPGFHGMLSNVDLSGTAGIDHFTIDKSPRLQGYALGFVLKTASSESCRPNGANPTAAKPLAEPTRHAAPQPRTRVAG